MKTILLVVMLVGCGGNMPVPDSKLDAHTKEVEAEFYEEDEDALGRPQGSLPPGYNERQCQWDACGGPLPDHQAKLSNPTPGNR